MEILLIGNGFDLEHNLPTSYNDFLDFCKRARRIYTLEATVSLNDYIHNNLDDWKMSDYIKGILSDAFEKRTYDKKVITPYAALNELYTHIENNTWVDYFLDCSANKNIGENWIDFESEISRVIQALDAGRFQVEAGGSVTSVEKNESKILTSIWKSSKWNLKSAFVDTIAIDKFTEFLNEELERLIRALEIYIVEFVGKITVAKRSADIEKLKPDHILSFNYSNTYERLYGKGKNIEYDYIHGKADINKNIKSSNLVLGIDEYLDDDSKNDELEFLTFKKFYQRIYKSTGNIYLDWVDEIKEGYAAYLKKENDTYARIVESFKDGSFEKYPFEKDACMGLSDAKCPQHTLYIFGHSLDVTDRDVLKLFIYNDNVQTKVFYYRKDKDDKKALGKLIRNLIKIMGQDELIRRTGGAHKTIEFIPQALSGEKQ